MIPIKELYDYPALERITHEDGTRYYIDPEGNWLPSVTTILSATDNNPELEAWKQRVGLKESIRIRDEATGLGSLMHEHLENYIQGIERPGGNNIVRAMARNMADQVINQGLCHVDEVWGIEKQLYFPGLYAGTSDLIAVYKGKPSIIDYKTATKMKSRDKLGGYRLQGAAYCLSHNHLFNTEIEQIVILMVDRSYKFCEFVFNAEEYEQACVDWIERLDGFVANFSKGESPSK